MARTYRSARGELVDIELLKIKADLANQTIVNIKLKNDFIDDGSIPKVIYNPNQKSSQIPNTSVDVGLKQEEEFETNFEEEKPEKRKGK